MKRFIYSTIALAAACLAFSCAKNLEEAPITEEAAQRTVRTFTCTFAEPDTKLDLNTSTGKSTWEVGDQIMVHGGEDGADFEVVTLTAGDISADGRKATISFTLDPYDRKDAKVESKYYAQYPASAVPTGDNMYYECRFNDTKNLLMGACDVGDTFVFFQLSGIITYKVSGSFATAVFSGNNKEAVGYDVYQARIRKDEGKDVRCYYWKPGNGSGTPVASTVYTSVPATDGTTLNYIYLPSGSGATDKYNVSYSGVNFTNGFTIKFLDSNGDEVKRVSTSTAKNIHAGEILNLGDITSHLYTYVPPATHDATNPAIAGAYDLGATNGTANCYLLDSNVGLEANKVYKFKAYQGNGTSNVGKISSVGVLWETYNDSNAPTANSIIAAVDYDKQSENEYYEITFKMPATIHAGNAVIVAKDNSDKILWSWHIWVPSSDVSSVDVSKICGSKLMDRNLGALEPVSTAAGTSVYSLGMFYEWGRKDPFLGPKRVQNDAGYALVAGTAPTVLSGSTMTIAETIKNPTQYASDGISDMDFTKWAKTKTIYDPCPPGYKLPYVDRSSSNPFTNSDLSTSLPAKGYGWESSTTGYWFKFSDGDNAVVFPLAGYVEEGLTESYYSYKNTIRAAVWYLCDSSSSPYHLNIRPSESTNAFGSTNLRRGCNVRCCVIE